MKNSILPAAVVAVGLLISPGVSPAQPPEAAEKVLVLDVVADGTVQEVDREIKPKALAGTYHVGDGLGYNLSLTLAADGGFECEWHGCLGSYGATSGTWSLRAGGLWLAPRTASGMFKDRPLGLLRVVLFREHLLLLSGKKKDVDFFREVGPATSTCFHQETARNALDQEQRRRIVEEVKAATAKRKK
jgi:hypothetical protein